MTDFHEMWYDHHATKDNPTYVLAALHSAEVGKTLISLNVES
jgi:hypothetical protein